MTEGEHQKKVKAVIQVCWRRSLLLPTLWSLSAWPFSCPELGGGGSTSYSTQAAPGRGCALAMTGWYFLVIEEADGMVWGQTCLE